MKSTLRLIVLAFAAWAVQQQAFSQESNLPDIRSTADSVYGLNDLLLNGRIHNNAHPGANGHPFAFEKTFPPGAVFIKGEWFGSLKVNYDATLDEPVLDVVESMPWIKYIVLNNKLIDSFLVGDRLFVHANTLPVKIADRVYLEKVFEGKFSLLARHQKYFKAEYSSWHPKGVYLDKPVNYLIVSEGSLYEVTREKQWLDYFAGHKKELKNYLRKNKIKLGKASIGQLKQLAVFCNGFYR